MNYKLKDIYEFVNEAKVPEGTITPSDIKAAVSAAAIQKKKFITNLRDRSWHIAIKPIEVKQKDIDTSIVAITGKYLITGFYKRAGEFKVEYVTCTVKSGAGCWTRAIDEKVWNKLKKKYESSLLDPKKLTKSDLDILASVSSKFLTKEAEAINKNIKPAVKGKLDMDSPASLGKALEDAVSGSEWYMLNDNERIRFNVFVKAAGSGSAVPKTNLWFVIEPKLKSVTFKTGDGILDDSFNYKDFKDLVSSIRDRMNDWKKRDKSNYEEGRYQAWKLDR
jgi:hypothetical protein